MLIKPFLIWQFSFLLFYRPLKWVNTGKKLLLLRKIIAECRQLILYYPVVKMLKREKNSLDFVILKTEDRFCNMRALKKDHFFRSIFFLNSAGELPVFSLNSFEK